MPVHQIQREVRRRERKKDREKAIERSNDKNRVGKARHAGRNHNRGIVGQWSNGVGYEFGVCQKEGVQIKEAGEADASEEHGWCNDLKLELRLQLRQRFEKLR